MTQMQTELKWEEKSFHKFTRMIEKIPLFHREIAQKVVHKKAEMNALERNAAQVEECDIMTAFFSEVPKAFYSLMIRLLDEVDFDYKQYEPK